MSFRDNTKRMSDLFIGVRDAKPPQRSTNSASEGVLDELVEEVTTSSPKNFVLYCGTLASSKAYEGPIPRSVEALNRLAMPQMQTCCPDANVLPTSKRAAHMQTCCPEANCHRRRPKEPARDVVSSIRHDCIHHPSLALPLHCRSVQQRHPRSLKFSAHPG